MALALNRQDLINLGIIKLKKRNTFEIQIMTECDECPVCKTFLLEPFVGTCGHSVCRLCMTRLQNKDDIPVDEFQCPLCRKESVFARNFLLDALLLKIYPDKYNEAKLTSPFFIEDIFQKEYPDFKIEHLTKSNPRRIILLNYLYVLGKLSKNNTDEDIWNSLKLCNVSYLRCTEFNH